jgi:hypothetical protein
VSLRIAGLINGNENLPMHFILDIFQDIVVALGKVVFLEGGFIWDRTTTIHFQKMLLFFIVQSPKQNIFRHQSMTQISEKIL